MKTLVLTLGFVLLYGPLFAIEKIEPDPVGAKLVSDFMTALSIQDENLRLTSVLPLIHDSLKSPQKNDLSSNVKRFSYEKAEEINIL
jgi:hypothetical protein